ncbi:MAG: hypothetical protein Q9174_004251 [Haloplaca sp. 1 TL-2023]
MSLEHIPDHGLHERFELLKGAEHHKNDLIMELLRRLDKLNMDYQQNRDPFVLALIDGDGMIFEDNYVQEGEAGGKEAAASLWNGIKDYIHNKLPDIPADCRIVTRIYANMKGLADICCKSGIVDRASLVEEFYRGFTGSKILFDFVDVGQGKDRADEKINELFKLHLSDFHCQHIFFGCSHDNGYARLLEQYTENAITKQITLLEGVPFEKEFFPLLSKYSATRFDNLFRINKINIYNRPPPSVPLPQHTTALPPPTGYQSPYQPIIGASSPSPVPSNSSVMNPKAATWASTATNAAHLVSPPPTPQPVVSQPVTSEDIPRNRYGQRIDPPTVYDKDEVNRLRKLKLCNVHFLRGDCEYEPCSHLHQYKMTKNETQALKMLARMIPCFYGTECDDPKCIYGHRCPVSVTGKKDCHFGDKCKFAREMHGIDLNVVRTTKVGKK